MNTITAQRGSERRTFSIGIWQTMPGNKYGWQQVADEPEAVTQLKLAKETTEEDYSDMIKKTRKSGDKEKLKKVLNAKVDES